MKTIKIKELGVSNFRGQNFCDKYGYVENKISGRNRSGKSTRLAAWCWLMCGYTDPNTPANSKIFDDRIDLTKDTPIASVWAVIDINGEEYRLERKARAKFIRKKGTEIYEKASSDEYLYSIDNIDRNATDYKEWLSGNIASEDMMRFVLGGEFFINQIFDDKKRARMLIERVVGKVTPEEMKGDYSAIAKLLEKYSLDDIDNRAANLSKSISQRLEEIPALIANMEREVSDIEQTNFVENEKETTRLEAQREDCEKRHTDLSERIRPQMEERAKAITAKQMKQNILDEAYAKWCKEPQEEIARLSSEIAAVRRQNEESKRIHDDAVKKIAAAERKVESDKRNLELAKERLQHCIEERDKELGRTMSQDDRVCKFCGAELTDDKLQDAITRFELTKRDNLKQIVARGKDARAEVDRLESEISKYNKDAISVPNIITQSTEELERKIAILSGHSTTIADFLETDLGKALQNDVDNVVIPDVCMPEDSAIKEEKQHINEALIPLYESRGLKKRAERLKNNIEELRTEQREKGAELAKYERQRQLVKEYKQEQMQILSHKVNDGLNFSKIEVWGRQKDGTLVPDIILKDSQGVSYSTTNNASRIVTAIDIQRFFCDKLGVNMPCFVDESSIINADNLPQMDNVQMFYLFCSETSLKIESI